MEGLTNRIKDLFSDSGINTKNVVTTTGIFAGLNIGYITILWSLCFFTRPTKFIIHRLPYPKLKDSFAQAQLKANEKVKNWKILKRVPAEQRGTVGISFVEMLMLKGMLGPVALPLKLWLAVKLTKLVTQNSS